MQELFTDNTSTKGNIIISFKDDEECNRLFGYLRSDGYGVYICRTFEEFMEINHVDLKSIIVEVTPGHESTFHAIEIIKQSQVGMKIPLLVVADVASTGNVVKALNVGANDYILQPYSRKEILQRVSALISRYPV